ncbi:MAG: NAD-dependent epimerase/dehydratase family protein, partial [Desulfobulbaceae bacterium]|nr:NAD-dependent epimerase/dehydratase family protein [Desulfobulbaceae bacterium]
AAVIHFAAYGIRYCALRYFNAAGADFVGIIGGAHNSETHLIPLSIMCTLGKFHPLTIFGTFGTDYPTHDGSAIRAYTHFNDLTASHIKAVQILSTGQESEVLNLGTGLGASVLELVETVASVNGRQLTNKYCPRRLGDPPGLVAWADKAKQILDGQVQFSDLDTIISSGCNCR